MKSLQFVIKIVSVIAMFVLRLMWGILRRCIWPFDVDFSRVSERPRPLSEGRTRSDVQDIGLSAGGVNASHGTPERPILQLVRQTTWTGDDDIGLSAGGVRRKYQPVLGLQITYSRLRSVRSVVDEPDIVLGRLLIPKDHDLETLRASFDKHKFVFFHHFFCSYLFHKSVVEEQYESNC
ncbi:uncharacterized protein LOC110828967 isoform X3 [Zootermopsis nevadensis]|uniref:uncharacterized protein LOC110828967 isoform X3 n=1 Tax=Zootermopsis nevadensis TaxID=136037 RepID=UPI000B8EE51A|nr:uncharacterized protein LOC110828967 isoform X3 [Zootermopsis nevadensis]